MGTGASLWEALVLVSLAPHHLHFAAVALHTR